MLRNFSLVFTVVIILAYLTGCQNDDIILNNEQDFIPAVLDVQFHLKVNQTAFLEIQDIKVKFLDVTEDSRCPADVICIWAGQATVLVNILKGDQDMGNLSLTDQLGNEALNTKIFDNFSIKLVKVEPYPISTQKIELKDYIATFIIIKKA